MAVFLVDYENVVGYDGLKGVEYLNSSDKLHIFYSDNCDFIKSREETFIEASKCEFAITKLKSEKKNAMDFYIACECGRLFESGEKQIVIISRDKGLTAVIDYFRVENLFDNTTMVCVRRNIEEGILELPEKTKNQRKGLIAEKNAKKDIRISQNLISEHKRIYDNIHEALKGTEYEKDADKIIDYCTSSEYISKRNLYGEARHLFGIHNGLAIYQKIREVV